MRAPPPSAVTKPSGKKPFPKAIIAVAAVVAAIAAVVGALVLLNPSANKSSNETASSDAPATAPKDFNGTVVFTKFHSVRDESEAIRVTVKDDELTVEDLSNDSSYSGKIVGRSQTDTSYVFQLGDVMVGNQVFGAGNYDDVIFTFYIPKGLDSQSPRGFFGATVKVLKAGTYSFQTNDRNMMLNLLELGADGEGRYFNTYAYNLSGSADFGKIDPTSDAYEGGYGSEDVSLNDETYSGIIREMPLTWEKKDGKVRGTLEGEDTPSWQEFELSLAE